MMFVICTMLSVSMLLVDTSTNKIQIQSCIFAPTKKYFTHNSTAGYSLLYLKRSCLILAFLCNKRTY